MNFINKFFETFNSSFSWKNNRKKTNKQKGGGLQVQQEKNSTTNIINIENVNVATIKELTGDNLPNNTNNLLKNAGQRFLAEQTARQNNFTEIVDKANLRAIDAPQELGKDWFLRWLEISQTVSRKNVQDILAKILSGQVTTKDTFSLRTLDVLKSLSKQEIILFQIFCNLTYSIPEFGNTYDSVITEPFGSTGDNGMLSLGLSYPNLTILQDAGLIQTDLNAWRMFKIPELLEMPFKLGPTSYALKRTSETVSSQPRMTIINFTQPGLELKSVLNLEDNREYNSEFFKWVKDKWNMEQITNP